MMNKISKSWKLWSLHLYDFNGKTTRKNYNIVMIPLLIVGILLTALLTSFLFGKTSSTTINVISSIIFIIYEVALFSGITSRRLNSVGASPWFAILMFIPKIGFYFLIILMFVPNNFILSNKKDNKINSNPNQKK